MQSHKADARAYSAMSALYDDEEVVLLEWSGLASDLGIPADVQQRLGALLISRYQEKHRHYHTLHHIRQLIDALNTDEYVRTMINDRRCVVLSILFHDIVYETAPGSPCNEEESAKLFEQELKEYLSPFLISKVGAYIRHTRLHDVAKEDDLDLKLFIDLDMSILGREDPGEYDVYAGQIRREYISIPKPAYCLQRGDFMRKWLASTKSKIFASDYFLEKFETIARRNMSRECDILETGNTLSGE